MNPFDLPIGSQRLQKPFVIAMLASLMILTAMAIARLQIKGVLLLLVLIPCFILVYVLLDRPRLILYLYLMAGFVLNGIPRYLPGVNFSFGLLQDFLLILALLALFKKGKQALPWNRLRSWPIGLFSIWLLYTILCVFNPESKSNVAWFYAMRGVALYIWLALLTATLTFDRRQDLQHFFLIWGAFSLFASIKAILQIHWGPDPFEQAWLNQGGSLTHMIWGRLRAFSFYSDAGQFGAAQAHAAFTALLLAFHCKSSASKLFFFIVAVASLYGMLLSGTRGAIFILLAAFLLYIIIKKNHLLLLSGSVLVLLVVVMLKFTYIGQGIYTIQRLRSAFNLNDASLQVRLENQRSLADYLRSRPLGGGVGSAGYWGQRYTPGSFLAETPTDSWYVRIWAEQGIIGLLLYLFIVLTLLFRGIHLVWHRLADPWIKESTLILLCGYFGVLLASYSNSIIGQSPTAPIIQLSLAFIFLAPVLDRNQKNHDAAN
jgi:O-antigen ligase